MDKFARQPKEERKYLLQEAASQMDLADIILEKDFWVCWTLKCLFTNSDLAPYLTFKGGTSLSKGYDVIERFSEDIDLTISRNAPFLEDGKLPSEDDISNNERKRRIEALKSNAQQFVHDVALTHIKTDIEESLGTSDGWGITLDQDDPDGQTILFHYPHVFDYHKIIRSDQASVMRGVMRGTAGRGIKTTIVPSYVRPVVRLEFGARGDIEPNEMRSIKPYAADIFPDQFENPDCDISMLGAERTFWEKATILHSLYHGVNLRDRMSRHYYDTFMLDQKGIADSAIQAPALLEQVVQNKSLMFKDNKASYETAEIGSLKLLPTKEQLIILKDDYKKMDEMFMADYPAFDEIMDGLSALEQKINQDT